MPVRDRVVWGAGHPFSDPRLRNLDQLVRDIRRFGRLPPGVTGRRVEPRRHRDTEKIPEEGARTDTKDPNCDATTDGTNLERGLTQRREHDVDVPGAGGPREAATGAGPRRRSVHHGEPLPGFPADCRDPE